MSKYALICPYQSRRFGRLSPPRTQMQRLGNEAAATAHLTLEGTPIAPFYERFKIGLLDE